MKIVYTLYEHRIEQRMSLRKLAELSGISKTTINEIENQNYNPTVSTICYLAEALQISPYSLFYIDNQ